VAPLAAALKDSNPRVRYGAALALGGTRDPGAADPLLASRDDQNASVRVAVLYALSQITGPRAIPSLLQALEDRDARVRSYAAGLLTEMTDQQFGGDAGKWREWWEKEAPAQGTP
jgi:HEAT repeat protein